MTAPLSRIFTLLGLVILAKYIFPTKPLESTEGIRSFESVPIVRRNESTTPEPTAVEPATPEPTTLQVEPAATPTTGSSCSHMLVGIKSAASGEQYKRRRNEWRESPCRSFYREAGIQYKFVVGLPVHNSIDPRSHNQGSRFSDTEHQDLASLKNESEVYEDIKIIPVLDLYNYLFLKTFRNIEWLSSQTTSPIVIIHDDEYCVNTTELSNLCEVAAETTDYIYAGHNLWGAPSYDSQKGHDGSFAPYFSGWLYVLSTRLARSIVAEDDFAHSLLQGNAPFSEDVQVGRWALRRNTSDGVPLRYINNLKLLVEVKSFT